MIQLNKEVPAIKHARGCGAAIEKNFPTYSTPGYILQMRHEKLRKNPIIC